ncbi:MAG: transglycosylase SLT domain-containing protein [Candidatus Eremiobacteraeota bacterium]|nr:transglycosylase SLT domain-containing protein [Candidatus Eremiobacteraeota bacterium]
MTITSNVAYGPAIAAAATRHHLDPRLLAAVAAQETGGPGSNSGRNVVGDGGHGHGLFQIDDRWHAFARTPAAMDPAQNADYAAGLLESNLNRYGDVRSALSAYNAGSPNATGTRTDWGDGQPVGYADSVFHHYAQLGGFGGAGASPGALAGASDPRDSTAEVDALRGLAGDLGQGAAGAQYCPVGAMPLNLPAYRPLAQPDATQRDLAPATGDYADALD